MNSTNMPCARGFSLLLARCLGLALSGCLAASHSTLAAPVTADTARDAVQGWLRQDEKPLGAALSARINDTQTVKNAAGVALYHVLQLQPAGYVIVAADDLVDPIIAFSAGGRFNSTAGEGVAAFLKGDLPRRLERARAGGQDARALRAGRKWRGILLASPNPPPDSEKNGNITVVSQVWVAPFVQTLWDQTTDQSLAVACYNYYTPPYGAGDVNNFPCGCVATALAQLLYYFHYPVAGVGTGSFTITVNGSALTTNLLGGNGHGGAYEWGGMTLVPNGPTAAQAQAVGALCFDAGVAVNMDYEANGSSASLAQAYNALTSTFFFASAGYDENDSSGLSGTSLLGMINPNVDARLPVMLGINGSSGGHCVLCDGYGYSFSTLFHHINAGWGGDDDVWYALPSIDTSDNGDYTIVNGCLYNAFTNATGQIISGRVTDPSGAPISGATVTAARVGGGSYTAKSDSNGIYALAQIPAASQYTLTASRAGSGSATGSYSTGTSAYYGASSGNVWGANFTLSPPLLALPESGFAAVGPAGGPFSVTAQPFSLTNASAAPVSWSLANNSSWLSASAAGGTVAAGAASSLTISLSAGAGILAEGTNLATIWITNLSNHLAQALAFSLIVQAADYPIAFTGFNDDVVVENTALGGNTPLYADVFDANNAVFHPVSSFCFYESGLPAVNLQGGVAVEGLPASGSFTSAADNMTLFQFGPYDGDNVLYLSAGSASGALTLASPLAYKSLSILAASSEGGGNGSLVLQFADGTGSSPIAFNAANYFTTNVSAAGAALTRFGILATGAYNEFYAFESSSFFPSIYQTSINLESLGLHTKPIRAVTFTMPAGAGVTGIFALSGTESPFPVITAQPQGAAVASGANLTMSIDVTGAAALNYRWLLNGSTVAGAQSNLLNITGAGAGNAGNYQVIVTNTSGAVTSLVAALRVTNVPVSFVSAPGALQYSGGSLILQLTNLAGQGQVVVSASSNLEQWIPIMTNPSAFGGFSVTDSAAGAFPWRFYRASTP